MVRLGILSDLHAAARWTPAMRWHHPFVVEELPGVIDTALARFERARVDAVIVCGDLTQDGDRPSARAVLAQLATAPAPVWVVPGNHDVVADDRLLESAVAELGGGRVRLVPRTSVALGQGVAMAAVGIGATGGGRVQLLGGAPARGDEEVQLVVSHYPLVPVHAALAAAGLPAAGEAEDPSGVRAAFARAVAPTVVVHGHQHVRVVVVQGHLLQWGQAALAEPPHDTTLLDIEASGDGARVRVHAEAVAEKATRPTLLSPGRRAFRHRSTTGWEEAPP
jgi:predicted phosphodiesterase